MIEWGDRFPSALPADTLLVIIHRTGETGRRFELVWGGPRAETLGTAWLAACRCMRDVT
jgi:tRNA A37 threonylcarbamoyladenosine biosynthesis protein TsaE